MDQASGAIDRQRLRSVKAREDERFARNHPASMALLARARRSMPRGVPMQWMASTYGHPPVFSADGKGAHFRCVDGHRFHMLNRGVWEAGGWANPVASVAHTAADIDRYLEVLDEAIDELAVKG